MTHLKRGHEPSNELPDRPPDTEHSQKISGGEGQEFQKQSSINRQIPTDADTHACVHGTYAVEIGLNIVTKVTRVAVFDLRNPALASSYSNAKDAA
jgi:hypothetical protein